MSKRWTTLRKWTNWLSLTLICKANKNNIHNLIIVKYCFKFEWKSVQCDIWTVVQRLSLLYSVASFFVVVIALFKFVKNECIHLMRIRFPNSWNIPQFGCEKTTSILLNILYLLKIDKMCVGAILKSNYVQCTKTAANYKNKANSLQKKKKW